MADDEHMMIWARRFISWCPCVGIRAGRFICFMFTLESCCE